MRKFLARSIVLILTIPMGISLKKMNVNAASYVKPLPIIIVAKETPDKTGNNSKKNGFYKGSDGSINVYKDGEVDESVNGVTKNTADGKMYNVVNGKVTPGPMVAFENTTRVWYYIDKNGTVDLSFNGIASN